MKQLNNKEKNKRDRLVGGLKKASDQLGDEMCRVYSSGFEFLGDEIKTNLSLAIDNLNSAIKKLYEL